MRGALPQRLHTRLYRGSLTQEQFLIKNKHLERKFVTPQVNYLRRSIVKKADGSVCKPMTHSSMTKLFYYTHLQNVGYRMTRFLFPFLSSFTAPLSPLPPHYFTCVSLYYKAQGSRFAFQLTQTFQQCSLLSLDAPLALTR